MTDRRHTLGRVSVVRGWQRWLLVGLGVALVSSLPAVIALWPPPAVAVDPARLRDLVVASADRPYQGYVDSRGHLNLPDLPVIGDVLALAGDSTRIRTWYAGPGSWRVATLTATGERDMYRTAEGTYVWDFERSQVSFTSGELPVRLPWAADLPPPELARRILSAASPSDSLTAIRSRRVAGVAAAGLRLRPSDPESTVAWVDVWADPDTGLPVRVEVTGEGAGDPVLVSEFLDLEQTRPDPALLVPALPADAGVSEVGGNDIAEAVAKVAPVFLPQSLAGRDSINPTLFDSSVRVLVPGISAYGGGLSTFVVLALPGRVGGDAMERLRRARGVPFTIGPSRGYELRVDLLTALIVHVEGRPGRHHTYLFAGLVTPELLRRAATDLITGP